MNIALEYTDEEKKLFDEAFRLKEEMNALQRESYVLRKERDEHVIENHTQGIPPIVYLALAFINLTIFISDLIVGFEFEMIHFAAAIAIASAAPALVIFFAVMFAISYRKYYYQVVQSEAGRIKAAELGILNYYTEHERIVREYESSLARLHSVRDLYTEKQKVLDALVESREAEDLKARSRKSI